MGGSDKDDEAPETEGKIKRTLESIHKQMVLSDGEMKYRMENFDNVDVVKEYLKLLKCTKCSYNFQQVIRRGDSVGIHPLLGVLMCDSCCDFYGDGDFSLDSEGEDKYCRWCGEGGTIFSCSKCICGFCDICIKKHFGEKCLEAVEKDDDWICYFCNPQPLWYLRSICSLAIEAARNKSDNLKKGRSGSSVKKKRRKLGSDFSKTSSDSSVNSCNSSGGPSIRKSKRRKPVQLSGKAKWDESSSSEDGKENHVNYKKRLVRSKKQLLKKEEDKESESDTKNSKKKSKTSSEDELENRKTLVLQKLKSIWKLTQTITEVGFSSSSDKLKSLSRSRGKTLEYLKREYEDLKSCMNVLVSSLNTASNSVNSIKEDLTFDTTKDETESFRIQESILKRFTEKFHNDSDDHTSSVDSEGDSFRKELKRMKGRKKQPMRGRRKSVRDSVRKKKRESGSSGEGEENSGGVNKSKSLSDSGSGEEKKKQDSVKREEQDENEKSGNVDKNSDSVKPLLKVKSFARMLDENVYDKNKSKGGGSPVVIDLSDTDESEHEKLGKKLSIEVETSSVKEQNCVNGRANNETPNKEANNDSIELAKSTEAKSKKTSEEGEGGFKERGRNSKKTDAGGETNENGKTSGEKTEKSDDEEQKTKFTANGENKESASGNEETKSTDDDGEGDKKESSGDKKSRTAKSPTKDGVAEGESGKATDTTESEGEKEEDKGATLENCGEKETSGEENEKKNYSDCSTTEVDDDDVTAKEKGKENEKEKNEGDAVDSDDEDVGKKDVDKTTSGSESEGKKDSFSKGSEEKEVSLSENKKNSSDDSSSSDEKRNTIKKRRKKQVKVSFEVFKQKREKFLKSSKENSKPKAEKADDSVAKALESSESENEKKVTKKKRGRPKKCIVSSSDEENKETADKEKENTSNDESEKENRESEQEEVKPSSASESSEEEEEQRKKWKRIRKREKGSSDSSEEGNKKKKRRGSSSESSEDETTKKKGRKNIRKILKKDSLQVETKEALKNEEERKKRLKERRKQFEKLFPEEKEQEEEGVPKRLILDFDPETKEPLVTVHKKLVKQLKPHQVKGIRFMWDSCFESVQKLEEESGSGCILAHCMGLGKTFQVITLVHTVMSHDLGVNHVLILCPYGTVSNWIREFETWLKNIRTDPITLYDLIKCKTREKRIFHLQDWHENGGVLFLSYELFRNLTRVTAGKGKKKKPKYQQIFEKSLLDPGPDLVVCDEGHLLKNENTALSKCMSRVKTLRRIILTGTPLQNNLVEYHCMVQFVKPNILGTKKEFCNRFVNPISNGQFEDSTELDVKIMKRRSHVLHSMLDGCVQRFDYSVLTPFLPEKHEYVLSISLTETQAKVYVNFINNVFAKPMGNERTNPLFHDYQTLQRVWTHPRTMLMHSERETQKEELESDPEGSLKDFVVSGSEESESSGSKSSDDSIQKVTPRKRVLRSNANDPEVQKAVEEEEKARNSHWWDEFYGEEACDDLRESNKLIILFSLLKYCNQKKDKLLVFSQSLYTLDLIEHFLARIDRNDKKDDETLCGHRDRWVLGTDYFRMDGSTTSEMRATWCRHFNKEYNTRARLFLISTRAGGLGLNLCGANRVVIFDASWNPSYDLQSIFRVYRFGQNKPCYIYRFLSEATMEEKIYERQVTKLSLAHRVVDEHQIERHYTMGNLRELYTYQPTPKEERKIPKLPVDSVLADLLTEHKEIIVGYHEHDSLLENIEGEELTEEERKAAWKEYVEEKTQANFNPAMGQQYMMQQLGQFMQPGVGMQQGQFVQTETGIQQILNPAALMNAAPNFINPMFVPTNFPIETVQRGMRLGVIPSPNESFDAYVMRILSREAWLQARPGQPKGRGTTP